MTCYYYKKINHVDNPILSNVDATFILTMENSNRFKPRPFLLNLSKETIIQYNKGFKKCNKPEYIKISSNDIIHAYYTLFNKTRDYENIIILEDDAEIYNHDISHYKKIDDYIKNNRFNALSFGTFGAFSQINKNFYTVNTPHGSHAIIFSKNYRSYLINKIEKNNFKGHMDVDYLNNNKVISYKIPLIIQLWSETENSKNWGNLRRIPLLIIGADKNKRSWEIIYFVNKNIHSIIVILITLIIVNPNTSRLLRRIFE